MGKLLQNTIILSWILSLSLLFSISIPPTPTLAWGERGHLTVCELAYRNLTESARIELKRLFHAPGGISVHSRDGVELRHYTSFNVGCLEEDENPRKHPTDHFINVDRSVSAIADDQCPSSVSCALDGVERDLNILKDVSKSDEDRVFALMALGHWIGDLHQPLHLSFADDRGGNGIVVKLQGKCGTATFKPKNLHSLWDNCLLEAGLFQRVRQRSDFKTSWGPRTVTYRAVDTLLANTSVSEELAMVSSQPWEWANESLQITLMPETLYCIQVGSICQYAADRQTLDPYEDSNMRVENISQAYLASFERTAEDRVRRAGFRLAHLINLALDPSYRTPLANSFQPVD